MCRALQMPFDEDTAVFGRTSDDRFENLSELSLLS